MVTFCWTCMFNIWRTPKLLYEAAAPFYAVTGNRRGFLFVQILVNAYQYLFNINICLIIDMRWDETLILIWFAFSKWLMKWHIFMWLLAICVSSLEKMFIQSIICPFLHWIAIFFTGLWVIYTFWVYILYHICDLHDSLLLYGLFTLLVLTFEAQNFLFQWNSLYPLYLLWF